MKLKQLVYELYSQIYISKHLNIIEISRSEARLEFILSIYINEITSSCVWQILIVNHDKLEIIKNTNRLVIVIARGPTTSSCRRVAERTPTGQICDFSSAFRRSTLIAINTVTNLSSASRRCHMQIENTIENSTKETWHLQVPNDDYDEWAGTTR